MRCKQEYVVARPFRYFINFIEQAKLFYEIAVFFFKRTAFSPCTSVLKSSRLNSLAVRMGLPVILSNLPVCLPNVGYIIFIRVF